MKHLLRLATMATGLGSIVVLGCATSARAQVADPALQCQPAKLTAPSLASLPNMLFCREQEQQNTLDTPKPLTAQQFIDLSLQGSAAVRSQVNLVESANYTLTSAKGAWWPNVSMSNSSLLFVTNTGNNNPNVTGCINSPATAGRAFNPFNGSSGNCSASSQYTQAYPVITITWNFINPSRYPQIAGAQKGVALAKSQLKQANQQLQLALLKSYGTYLLAGYQIGELSSLISLERQILNATSRLVQNRAIPRFVRNQQGRDLLSYQARMVNAMALQKQAYGELSSALSNSSLAGQPLTPDLNSLVLRQWAHDQEKTVAMALANSENLKQLGLQSGIATDNANQLRGTILPTIGVLGYVTYQGTDSTGVVSNLLSNYIGLSVSWNLFDGYTTKNQAIASDRQAFSYNNQKVEAERQLRLLVNNKLINLASLNQQINIYLGDISHAQSIASDFQQRQKYGLSTELEVLQAQQDNHESKLQLISAITNYVINYTELSSLCGLNPLE